MLRSLSIFSYNPSTTYFAAVGSTLAFSLCMINLLQNDHFEAPCDPNCTTSSKVFVDIMTTLGASLSGGFAGIFSKGIYNCFVRPYDDILRNMFEPVEDDEQRVELV